MGHGMSYTRFYKRWRSMMNRCYSKCSDAYRNYGLIGVFTSDDWKEFIKFKEDMYESYKSHVEEFGEKNTSLDRVDNTIGYCKGNCRWVTLTEQANNKRTNKMVEYNGVTDTISNWCRKYGITPKNAKNRLNLGWSVHDTFNIPVKKRPPFK